MRAPLPIRLALVLACALGAVACGNPVRDNLKRSLGPEDPNVPRGPLHRPGQPCTVCHSKAGGVEPPMSVAGTVFQVADSKKPARNVIVQVVDAQGRHYSVATNCAGNFYIQENDFQPAYPIKPRLAYGNLPALVHKTQIFRDGSCASCHTDPVSATSPGHVYIDTNGVVDFPSSGCP